MTYRYFDDLPLEAVDIRRAVFVEEQGFIYEFDDRDHQCVHIVMYDEAGRPIAVSRTWNDGDGEFVLGRIAVVRECRGKSLGSEMIAEAERYAAEHGGRSVRLHAQCRAAGFYRRCGYTEFGAIDDEEGLPHVWMRKILDK